jgi:hypothetical protein
LNAGFRPKFEGIKNPITDGAGERQATVSEKVKGTAEKSKSEKQQKFGGWVLLHRNFFWTKLPRHLEMTE